MGLRYERAIFTPDEFYECLINLRRTNPAAFARFASRTDERLRAYEEAKSEAAGRRADGNDSKGEKPCPVT
ncbi:MAG TPA: hypothetical protein VGC87_13975 [Pyrinomonadaceae bacterium]|jgi:hypothetical protein